MVSQASSLPEVVRIWLNTPWYSQLLNFFFLLCAVGVVLFAFFMAIKMIRMKFSKKDGLSLEVIEEERKIKEEAEDDSPSLLHHRIFSFLASTQSNTIIDFDKSAKATIALIYLKECKFKVWERELSLYLKEIENNEEDFYGFTKKIVEIEEKILEEAEKTPVILRDNRRLPYIPNIFIIKYNDIERPFMPALMKNIEVLLTSRYYDNWKTRAFVCLELLLLNFEYSIKHAEDVVKVLNGDLDAEIACILRGEK